jgi:hypothetical protein
MRCENMLKKKVFDHAATIVALWERFKFKNYLLVTLQLRTGGRESLEPPVYRDNSAQRSFALQGGMTGSKVL